MRPCHSLSPHKYHAERGKFIALPNVATAIAFQVSIRANKIPIDTHHPFEFIDRSQGGILSPGINRGGAPRTMYVYPVQFSGMLV